MRTKAQAATATKVVNAPAKDVYRIIADYRSMHYFILPKQYFLSLDVEEGGFGHGTIINFEMRILGKTQSFRCLVTEPQPGRLLIETDIRSETPTSFHVISVGNDDQTRVSISTELKGRNRIEAFVAKVTLQKVYRDELDLLAKVAEENVKLARAGSTNKIHQGS